MWANLRDGDKVASNRLKIQSVRKKADDKHKGICEWEKGFVMDHPKPNWKPVKMNKSWSEVVPGFAEKPGRRV